jgi:uncharacterized protein YxjI
MRDPQQYEIGTLDLSGSEYTVEQTGTDKHFRPEYEVRDVSGDTIFRCTHNMYDGADNFPFVDTDGSELFSVKASSDWDIAGEYLLTDSQTGEELVVLDNDFSFFQDTWRIRDVEDESVVAEISSRGAFYTVARKILPVGRWIGHTFDITDSDGDSVGSIESSFAVFDEYKISIRDRSSVPIDPVVATVVVIDGSQQN